MINTVLLYGVVFVLVCWGFFFSQRITGSYDVVRIITEAAYITVLYNTEHLCDCMGNIMFLLDTENREPKIDLAT